MEIKIINKQAVKPEIDFVKCGILQGPCVITFCDSECNTKNQIITHVDENDTFLIIYAKNLDPFVYELEMLEDTELQNALIKDFFMKEVIACEPATLEVTAVVI